MLEFLQNSKVCEKLCQAILCHGIWMKGYTSVLPPGVLPPPPSDHFVGVVVDIGGSVRHSTWEVPASGILYSKGESSLYFGIRLPPLWGERGDPWGGIGEEYLPEIIDATSNAKVELFTSPIHGLGIRTRTLVDKDSVIFHERAFIASPVMVTSGGKPSEVSNCWGGVIKYLQELERDNGEEWFDDLHLEAKVLTTMTSCDKKMLKKCMQNFPNQKVLQIFGKWETNYFISSDLCTLSLGNLSSRVNHSSTECNSVNGLNSDKTQLVWLATSSITPGTEVFTLYSQSYTELF